jgi:hypothetical protein
MTIAEQVAKIDNNLESAHLVLLDLASGNPVPADAAEVLTALADLEEAREMLYSLAADCGKK